jgi:hypothetical protein
VNFHVAAGDTGVLYRRLAERDIEMVISRLTVSVLKFAHIRGRTSRSLTIRLSSARAKSSIWPDKRVLDTGL